jgi:hypothetical protein
MEDWPSRQTIAVVGVFEVGAGKINYLELMARNTNYFFLFGNKKFYNKNSKMAISIHRLINFSTRAERKKESFLRHSRIKFSSALKVTRNNFANNE